MIRWREKTQMEILYYIRQAGEISLSDLVGKVFPPMRIVGDSEKYDFLRCLSCLLDANFIRITVNADDVNNVMEIVNRAYWKLINPQKEHIKEIFNTENILFSITEEFNEIKWKIGFSLTDEIHHFHTKLKRRMIFGDMNRSLKSKVFVIMPFAEELKPIYDDHIKNVCNKLNYECVRADSVSSSNVITNDIWSYINNSDIMICDCTGKNPNVFYELGLAHALGKKVVIITQNAEDIPFDLKPIRYIKYDYTPRGMERFEEELEEFIQTTLIEI